MADVPGEDAAGHDGKTPTLVLAASDMALMFVRFSYINGSLTNSFHFCPRHDVKRLYRERLTLGKLRLSNNTTAATKQQQVMLRNALSH
jgi:hypothetical protein